MKALDPIDAAEAKALQTLGGRSGISGIGVEVENDTYLIRVNVERSAGRDLMDRIPKTIDGFAVKIYRVGPIVADRAHRRGEKIATAR